MSSSEGYGICEHCAGEAPMGARFCSDECEECEHTDAGDVGCAGICLPAQMSLGNNESVPDSGRPPDSGELPVREPWGPGYY